MSIVQKSDFIGEYKVGKDKYDDLDYYITKFEKFYLLRLLGSELYDLFIADLTLITPQVPQTARFLTIFNEWRSDDDGCLRISEGIKPMLVQFIYFKYQRDVLNKKTTSGVVRNDVELSVNLGYTGFNLVQSYNEGVDNYGVIRWYICDNSADYPEENGVHLPFISGI